MIGAGSARGLPDGAGGALQALRMREVLGCVPCSVEARFLGHSRWDVQSLGRWQKPAGLFEHNGCVNTIQWSTDGTLAVSGSDDRVIKIWDTRDLTNVKLRGSIDSGHFNNIFCADFVPGTNNRWVISCAADGMLRLHDVVNEMSTPLYHSDEPIHTFLFWKEHAVLEPGSTVLFSAQEDGAVVRHDLRQPHGQGDAQSSTVVRPQSLFPFAKSIAMPSTRVPGMLPYHVAIGSEVVDVYDLRRLPPMERLSPGATRRAASAAAEDADAASHRVLRYAVRRGMWPHGVSDSESSSSSSTHSSGSGGGAGGGAAAGGGGAGGEHYRRRHSRRRQRRRCLSHDHNHARVQQFCPSDCINGKVPFMPGMGVSSMQYSHDARRLLVSYQGYQIFEFCTDVAPARAEASVHESRMFGGHINCKTFLKSVSYFGAHDQHVLSGSDSGHIFVWHTRSARIEAVIKADGSIVNGVIPHPRLPALASYGIDSEGKLWLPGAASGSGRAAAAAGPTGRGAVEEDEIGFGGGGIVSAVGDGHGFPSSSSHCSTRQILNLLERNAISVRRGAHRCFNNDRFFNLVRDFAEREVRRELGAHAASVSTGSAGAAGGGDGGVELDDDGAATARENIDRTVVRPSYPEEVSLWDLRYSPANYHEWALRAKLEGNAHFKNAHYELASLLYDRALSYLRAVSRKTLLRKGELQRLHRADSAQLDGDKDAQKLKLDCMLNLAICELRMGPGRVYRVIEMCELVLLTHHDNVKALYLRGCAHLKCKNYSEAVADLRRCCQLSSYEEEGVVKKLAEAKRMLAGG